MQETKDFRNDGFGWACKHCEREFASSESNERSPVSRLMREGEAESRIPLFSNSALAKWADRAERILVCPRCNISELIDA